MKKTTLYGIVISVFVIGIMFLNTFLSFIDDEILIIILVALIILIVLWNHRKTNKHIDSVLQEVIPENVGVKSYIDENTRTIFLRSHDYHTRGGQEWVVTLHAITINQNHNNTSTAIPFSQMHRINLNHENPISGLEIEVLAMRRHDASGDGTWGVKNRLEAVSGGQIFFHEHDFNLASTIRDRIIGA